MPFVSVIDSLDVSDADLFPWFERGSDEVLKLTFRAFLSLSAAGCKAEGDKHLVKECQKGWKIKKFYETNLRGCFISVPIVKANLEEQVFLHALMRTCDQFVLDKYTCQAKIVK